MRECEKHFRVNGQETLMSKRLRVLGPNGETFRNGIGVSSSPATKTLDQWRELWRYGAGYIVIKTATYEREGDSLQARLNSYQEGTLITIEHIGKTSREQKPLEELIGEIKSAREEGIFVIPSITSKNPDLSVWKSMVEMLASTGVPYFESTLRYPYRGIMAEVVEELRRDYGYFDFDFNEYNVGIVPITICKKRGLDPRYIETETNRRFENFLEAVAKYSNEKRIGMIAKLWGGRHDLPALVARCALAGTKGITLANSFQTPPLRDFPAMEEYKRANVSGADLRRLRNSDLAVARETLQDPLLPKVTLFASGGVAVELASGQPESLDKAIDDVILCLELGADMVQLYTAIHQDYTLLGSLIAGLDEKLKETEMTFREFGENRAKFTGRNRPIYRLFQIDPDTCVGCGLCAKTSYCDAIKPVKDSATFEIHPNDCSGCGLCAKVCPGENTITEYYPTEKERT